MDSYRQQKSRAYDRTGREVSSEFKPDPDPNPKESSLLSTGSEIPVTHHPQWLDIIHCHGYDIVIFLTVKISLFTANIISYYFFTCLSTGVHLMLCSSLF